MTHGFTVVISLLGLVLIVDLWVVVSYVASKILIIMTCVNINNHHSRHKIGSSCDAGKQRVKLFGGGRPRIHLPPSLLGGGMINNRVKNAGTGGKSKVARTPVPKEIPPGVSGKKSNHRRTGKDPNAPDSGQKGKVANVPSRKPAVCAPSVPVGGSQTQPAVAGQTQVVAGPVAQPRAGHEQVLPAPPRPQPVTEASRPVVKPAPERLTVRGISDSVAKTTSAVVGKMVSDSIRSLASALRPSAPPWPGTVPSVAPNANPRVAPQASASPDPNIRDPNVPVRQPQAPAEPLDIGDLDQDLALSAAKDRILRCGGCIYNGWSNSDGIGPLDKWEGQLLTASEKAAKARKSSYIYADRPNVMCHYEAPKGTYPDPTLLRRYDCHGAPYCGVTCIDIGRGGRPDPERYEELAGPCPSDAFLVAVIGDSDFLIEYARHHGHNLLIVGVDMEILVQTPDPNHDHKWIVLCYVDPGEEGVAGHYELMVANNGDDSGVHAPTMDNTAYSDWDTCEKVAVAVGLVLLVYYFVNLNPGLDALSGWTAMAVKSLALSAAWRYGSCRETEEVVVLGRFLNRNNTDERPVVDRRDPIKFQDSYLLVEVRNQCLRWSLFNGWVRVKEFDWFMSVEHLTVSETRYTQMTREAMECFAAGRDPGVVRCGINRLREVNTVTGNGHVLPDTLRMVDLFISRLGKPTNRVTSNEGIVAYNASANAAAGLAEGARPVVAANQLLGMGGRRNNHVRTFRLDKAKVAVPVAVAPAGAPITDRGPVGPGLYSVTDAPGLLTAFVSRSMVKAPVQVDDFVKFSKSFCDKYINETDVEGMVEPDVCVHYREHFAGKKPAAVIDQMVDLYQRYLAGKLTEREERGAHVGGAFVKFESNVKRVGEGYRVKPRLIMTMGEVMAIETCPLSLLFDRWNAGPFGAFQIKHMEPSEMIQKIASAADRSHTVTDYSSFESSITSSVREIETYVMKRLAERAGFFSLRRALERHCSESYSLKVPWGLFEIQSRCSGHTWTSFGNGVVNVCINAYVCHLAGKTLSIIAEGDDGVVPAENVDMPGVNRLGFSLSSEVSGSRPGDTDFLRSRWVDGRRYVSVGRSMSVFWVKNGCKLKKSKQKFLLRAAAYSLHALSPGHPVLFEVVNRIFRFTSGANEFRNWRSYLNHWHHDLEAPPKQRMVVEVDETMREVVASGAIGFPPISIGLQLELERRLREDRDFYIGNLLNEYGDVMERVVMADNTLELMNDHEPVRDLVYTINHASKVVRECVDSGSVTSLPAHDQDLVREAYVFLQTPRGREISKVRPVILSQGKRGLVEHETL